MCVSEFNEIHLHKQVAQSFQHRTEPIYFSGTRLMEMKKIMNEMVFDFLHKYTHTLDKKINI